MWGESEDFVQAIYLIALVIYAARLGFNRIDLICLNKNYIKI